MKKCFGQWYNCPRDVTKIEEIFCDVANECYRDFLKQRDEIYQASLNKDSPK